MAELNSIEEILADLRAGSMVVIMDDEDRENEGDLIMVADKVRPEDVNFMARYGRGLICLTLTRERCRQLRLPLMVGDTDAGHMTNFTLSIEAVEGVTTGISAYDRAHTIRTAVRPDARPEDLRQPGHIFPLMAQPGGVLTRAGHTEAGCDLARLAGLNPAAVLCEVMNDDGTMARLPDLLPFAARHGLKVGTIADLIHYRAANESMVERVGAKTVQTSAGPFELVVYRDKPSGAAHLALVHGPLSPDEEALVRVHEPLSVLDLLDVEDSVHSWPVHKALKRIAANGGGVVVMLNCADTTERLLDKFNTLMNPDAAHQWVERTQKTDLRTYGVGAQILRDLNVKKMKLLAKPRKMPSMTGFGLQVTGYLES